MTARPLDGWHSFRWADSPGEPHNVLVGTSPEGGEYSIGEVLNYGHGVRTAILLDGEGAVLLEESVRDLHHGRAVVYGWLLYYSPCGAWAPGQRELSLRPAPPPDPPRRRRGPRCRAAQGALGKALRAAREARGWSLTELAMEIDPLKAASVTGICSGLERGVLRSSSYLPAILQALQMEYPCGQ